MSWQDIKESKEARDEALASAKHILDQAREANQELTDEQVTEVQALQDKAEKLTSRITILEADAKQQAGDAAKNTIAIDKDCKRYSFVRALHRLATNKPLDGIEAELNQEMARMAGKDPKGMFVPNFAFMPQNAVITTSTGSGAIGEDIDSNYAEHLKAKSILGMLGARIITGLTADRTTPVITAGVTAAWGENATNQSEPTIGSVTLQPKRVSAWGDISKVLLAQTSGSVEDMVRDDFVRGLAAAVEGVALEGGGSDEPSGIIDTVSATESDVALDYASVVALWSAVATNNADIGSLGWATSPSLAADLMTTEKATNTAAFIMRDDTKQIMGLPTGVTTNVPTAVDSSSDAALIFGNFNDLVVGFFGPGADVTVDPFSQASTGKVRVTVEYFADVVLRRSGSFAYSTFA
jgi:HK97 family phage major capsid protein